MEWLDVAPIQQLLSPLASLVSSLSDASGLPVDKINFLMVFLLSYPLAIIFRYLQNTTVRHIYSAFWGILIVIYMMGNDFYHSLFSAAITYLILYFVRNPIGTKLIWLWAFGYMTGSHLYRLYIDYLGWSVDFTIVQMVFTLKFCALACNLQDGAFPQGQVSGVHKARSISKPPTILEYISYLYYWCTILPGPFFEFNEYISFVNRSMFEKSNKQVPAGSYLAALKIWVRLVIVFIGVFLAFDYTPNFLWADQALVDKLSFWESWGLMLVSFTFFRCSYYTGWMMSEAAAVLSGFGFNGYDSAGNATWDRLKNNDVIGCEFGQSLKDMIASWNKGTAQFLKIYVYFRVSKPRPTPGQDPKTLKGLSASSAQLVVFMISAFWHGFYPGYYYFFVTVFFFNHFAAYANRTITPWLYTGRPKAVQFLYSVLCVLLSLSALNYSALSFVALAHERAVTCWSNLYWVGHIVCVILFIITLVNPIPRRKFPETGDKKKVQ